MCMNVLYFLDVIEMMYKLKLQCEIKQMLKHIIFMLSSNNCLCLNKHRYHSFKLRIYSIHTYKSNCRNLHVFSIMKLHEIHVIDLSMHV